MSKKRADLILVEKGLAVSRTQAQEMIRSGQVFWGPERRRVEKAGQLIEEHVLIGVTESLGAKYVSRAGFKLEKALQHLRLDLVGQTVLDVGMSTGGFSDCVLQSGARLVIGLDVGHGQLHEKIKKDSRVRWFEGINARHLSEHHELIRSFPSTGFDLIVMDVSFISMTLILPVVWPYLGKSGIFLGLVKPQFEVGPENLAKGGLVKDPHLHQEVEKKIREAFKALPLILTDYFPSGLEGKDGNKEFFVSALRI